MSEKIRAAQVRASEETVIQDLIAMRLIAAPQHKAHPTPPAVPSDAMVDAYLKAQRATVEEADRFGRPNVGGLHTNTVREACRAGLSAAIALAAPVASNTTAEPAPIQPAGVEVERDAARYRWLRSGVRSRQGIVMKGGKRSIDQSSHRAMVEFDFWCSPEELDAAIDQAIRAAASQGDRGKT